MELILSSSLESIFLTRSYIKVWIQATFQVGWDTFQYKHPGKVSFMWVKNSEIKISGFQKIYKIITLSRYDTIPF